MMCRSDCDEMVTRKVIAISPSGRRWAAGCCGSAAHMDAKLSMYDGLGYLVDEVLPA